MEERICETGRFKVTIEKARKLLWMSRMVNPNIERKRSDRCRNRKTGI